MKLIHTNKHSARKFLVATIAGFVLVAGALAAEPDAVEERKPKDDAFADWQKLAALLQKHYLDKDAVGSERLNEAMVKGILESLGSRARIVEKSDGGAAKGSPAVARAEVINGTIG